VSADSILLLLPLLAVAVLFLLRRTRTPAVVIGWQLAEARECDRRIRERATRPSPMPAGEYSRSEQSLIDPREVPYDAALHELVQRYIAADETARTAMLDAMSTDDFYDLWTLARREAVFAMRGRSPERLVSAMNAIAIVDSTRIDYRDVLVALPLLDYVARKTGADPDPMLLAASVIAVPEMRSMIENFVKAPAKNKSLESAGMVDVQTGFVSLMIDRYHPTHDLIGAGIAVHRLLDQDHYAGSSVTAADNPPAVWFDGAERELRRIRGGVAVHGDRDGQLDQNLMIFIAEAEDAEAAETLRQAALRKDNGRPKICFTRGSIVCLMIGSEPLERFEAPIAALLQSSILNPQSSIRE
jgi:hypothetical protein